ncbi:flagellar assembly protein FliH [Spirochaeta lutea]|uniref:Flagellar assembly protein FliH n=1 Tax=Spirochaeta lutea TaxID=1480694 RepID=A0A098R046_9SPIO|nr:flagellar assembly protein FliH [Spirochaeta lutea]KGE73525.1 flagellar assembly protein FliH [Spirochaeta lutea]
MAKNLFRGGEVKFTNEKVHISPPEIMIRQQHQAQRQAVIREAEAYDGPTADDLRREAEAFKEQWDAQRERLIEDAKQEAQRIIQEAEEHAFEEVKKKNDKALAIKQEAEQEAEKMLNSAKDEATRLVDEANREAEDIREAAKKEGYQIGFSQGYEKGEEEVNRVVERVHLILTKAIDRRNEIIEESEGQLIQLVLQIAKKVIKVLSENQKNIVVNNIVQALRKLKSKADVIIRVNLLDLKTTTAHTKELIAKFERVSSITVMEDSTVGPGGCIIETDFGQIDARISSQLREIEEKILELTPISAQKKPVGT